jgi:hypothetical protein
MTQSKHISITLDQIASLARQTAQELCGASHSLDELSHRQIVGLLDDAANRMDHIADMAGEVHGACVEPPHVKATGFCWERGLPEDALTLVALQRVAARLSAQRGIPMGYENEPESTGEGITFREDVLLQAARELGLC